MQKYFKYVAVIVIALGAFVFFGSFSNKDIYFVYTSDIHSQLDGIYDYSSIANYKKEYSKNGHVVLIDGGDFSTDGEPGKESKGAAIIDYMNDAKYDVVTLGNHDFDFGMYVLADNVNNAKFDVVVSNMDYIGEGSNPLKNIKKYVIKRYGSKKIAYFGFINPYDIKQVLIENHTGDEDKMNDYNFYCDMNDPEEDGSNLVIRMQELVDEVRDKVDYVVFISHLGTKNTQILGSRNIPIYVSGVDIILNAHSHDIINETLMDKDNKEVVLLSTGNWLKTIGIVKIDTNSSISADLITE